MSVIEVDETTVAQVTQNKREESLAIALSTTIVKAGQEEKMLHWIFYWSLQELKLSKSV
jgi:hypothetical protein